MNLDLGVILSLTTGKLLVNPIQLHEAIDYIYSEYNNRFLDVEESAQLTSEYVLYLYPQLAGVGVSENFETIEQINDFINKQKVIYGDSLAVQPITETISFELTSQERGRSR